MKKVWSEAALDLSSPAAFELAAHRVEDERTLAALETVVRNLTANPREPRYRTLRLSNPTVRSRLSVTGSREFLQALGYVESADYLALNGLVDAERSRLALDALASARASLKNRTPRKQHQEDEESVLSSSSSEEEANVSWSIKEEPVKDEEDELCVVMERMARAPPDAELHRVTRPAVGWDSVMGLKEAKLELQAIVRDEVGMHSDVRRILLYGPPGCGKAQLARAMASEWGRGDLVTAYGSELCSRLSKSRFGAVGRLYQRAKALAPCVLLLKGVHLGLSELLRELENCKSKDDEVIVIVTNSDEIRLPASKRGLVTSRSRKRIGVADSLSAFDQLLHVTAPGDAARKSAMRRAITRDCSLDIEDLAVQMEGFSVRGVLFALSQAQLQAHKQGTPLTSDHFDVVLNSVPMLHSLTSASLSTGATVAARRQAADGLICDAIEAGTTTRLAWLAVNPAGKAVIDAYYGLATSSTSTRPSTASSSSVRSRDR